jgi:competence protein ComGC
MNRNVARRTEAGMTTIEAIVLAPVILVLVLFIVFLGRVTTTQQSVQRAARAAARAASQSITRDDAALAINSVVDDSLGTHRQHCSIAPTDLTAIGEDTGAEGDWDLGLIQVRITCIIPTTDLGLLGLGTKTFTAVATEPVDTWRSRKVNT